MPSAFEGLVEAFNQFGQHGGRMSGIRPPTPKTVPGTLPPDLLGAAGCASPFCSRVHSCHEEANRSRALAGPHRWPGWSAVPLGCSSSSRRAPNPRQARCDLRRDRPRDRERHAHPRRRSRATTWSTTSGAATAASSSRPPRSSGRSGVGVDLDPQRIREAQANAVRAGVADRVTFRVQDIFDTDIEPATVVTLFLSPELNARLRPKLTSQLKPGSRIVSHRYGIGDWVPEETRTVIVSRPVTTSSCGACHDRGRRARSRPGVLSAAGVGRRLRAAGGRDQRGGPRARGPRAARHRRAPGRPGRRRAPTSGRARITRFWAAGDAERAARCAFWLGFGLLLEGERRAGGGWLARAQRLLDEGRLDCVGAGISARARRARDLRRATRPRRTRPSARRPGSASASATPT